MLLVDLENTWREQSIFVCIMEQYRFSAASLKHKCNYSNSNRFLYVINSDSQKQFPTWNKTNHLK